MKTSWQLAQDPRWNPELGGIGGAISAIGQGEATAAGDEQNAKNSMDKYWEGLIKANQTDTAMTQHLTETLGNINAVRAASGVEMASPSGTAIENATIGLGNQDITRTVGNIQNQAFQDLQASQFYTKAAQTARDNEGLGVAGALIGGIGGLLGKFI